MAVRPFRPTRRGALALAALGAVAAGAASAATPAEDPANFSYAPLPSDGQVDVAIDAHSPTFEFKPGRSGYRAFRLPDGERAYHVEVQSFLSGGPDPRVAQVLYPVVALLTDDFLLSRQTELEALRFDLPVFEAADAPAYRVAMTIDPAQAHERYLVIYTPATLFAPRPLPEVATAEAAAELARHAYLGAAPSGRLRITVHGAPSAPVLPGAPPAGANRR